MYAIVAGNTHTNRMINEECKGSSRERERSEIMVVHVCVHTVSSSQTLSFVHLYGCA